MIFTYPPHWKRPDGSERRAGFEFELAAVELETCIHLISSLFGGKIMRLHSLEARISDTSLGTFKVELDSRLLKKLAAQLEERQPAAGDVLNIGSIRLAFSKWLGEAAAQIVPCEIVSPPLLLNQFHALEKLREELYLRNAEGTKAGLIHAFGMHINPDILSLEPQDTLNILRAFLVLYPWLKVVMEVDLTRRLLTFIDPFPEAYVRLVLQPAYAPGWDRFIADYLEYNPTRNRALDLLPLFVHLRPGTLMQLNESERSLVKPRPAFHYRLPNCEIDNPDWRIARDWNYWVEVETLAADQKKLSAMAAEYLLFLEKPFSAFSREWVEETGRKFGYGT